MDISSRRIGGFLCLVFAAWVPSAMAEVEADPREGAALTLALDKERYLLGENVLVHYRLENTGDQPITISTGGDYRSTGLAQRFRVTVVDEQGEEVPQRIRRSPMAGGIGGRRTLEPGEVFWASLPLLRHAWIERPGVYRVTVMHDLGWSRDGFMGIEAYRDLPERDPPQATTKVTITMPTTKQAKRLVDEALSAPKSSGVFGERKAMSPDVRVLRHEVFRERLVEHARGENEAALAAWRARVNAEPETVRRMHLRQGMSEAEGGDPRAILALRDHAEPEATAALIALLEHRKQEIVEPALNAVAERVPLAGDKPREGYGQELARWLHETSWRPEHARPLRFATHRLLLYASGDIRGKAAHVMAGVVEAEDFDALVAAANRGDLWGHAWWSMCQGMTASIQAGATPPADPGTPGEAMAFCLAIKEDAGFRPAGWFDTMLALMSHEWNGVRSLAMKQMPIDELNETQRATLINTLAANLKGPISDTHADACQFAQRIADPALLGPVLSVLRRAENDERWLWGRAWSAAANLGGRDRAITIAIDRLDEHDEAAPTLYRLIENARGGSYRVPKTPAQTERMQRAWRAVLDAHRDTLRDGGTIKREDPLATDDLLAPGTSIHFLDDSVWKTEADMDE